MAQPATAVTEEEEIIPKIGDVVLLEKTIASVMYLGPVHWTNNINELYVGLEIPEAIPNGHDGTYDNTIYFKCKPKHGIILPITTIIKIISPQELLNKLSTFKTKLNTINHENEKIKQQINELTQANYQNDDDDDQKEPNSEIVITKNVDFNEKNNNNNNKNNGNAELHGLLLEKNGKIYKVQLRSTDGQLTDKIIDIHEKYVQIIPDYDITN